MSGASSVAMINDDEFFKMGQTVFTDIENKNYDVEHGSNLETLIENGFDDLKIDCDEDDAISKVRLFFVKKLKPILSDWDNYEIDDVMDDLDIIADEYIMKIRMVELKIRKELKAKKKALENAIDDKQRCIKILDKIIYNYEDEELENDLQKVKALVEKMVCVNKPQSKNAVRNAKDKARKSANKKFTFVCPYCNQTRMKKLGFNKHLSDCVNRKSLKFDKYEKIIKDAMSDYDLKNPTKRNFTMCYSAEERAEWRKQYKHKCETEENN